MSDERFVEMLLKAGADVDEPDALGVSAKQYAVLFNKPKILGLFKKYAGK
jgi:ankyrin repeat protein